MKRPLLALMVLLLMLAGCSSQPQIEQDGSLDFQKNFHNGNTGSYSACESKTGYYFLVDNFLHYMEKKTGKTTIACSKLNCTHSTPDCDAYINSNDIAYYNGKLYYAEISGGSGTLYSADLDGTNRHKMISLGSTASGDTPYILHRGYVYYVNNTNLMKYQLSKSGSKEEHVHTFPNISGADYKLWGDENFVYIDTEAKDYQEVVYRYDIERGGCKLVWSVPSVNVVGNWESAGIGANGLYVSDGIIYYYLSGNGVWKYDIGSGKNTRLFRINDKEKRGIACFDAHYIYINNAAALTEEVPTSLFTLYVYNYQGKEVNKIPYGQFYSEHDLQSFDVLGTTDSGFFCQGVTSKTINYDFGDMQLTMPKLEVYYIQTKNSQTIRQIL